MSGGLVPRTRRLVSHIRELIDGTMARQGCESTTIMFNLGKLSYISNLTSIETCRKRLSVTNCFRRIWPMGRPPRRQWAKVTLHY
jgi:hypothetical protein